MNEIKVKRLILAGIATLVVFIIVESAVESVLGKVLFQNFLNEWYREVGIQAWGARNHIVNIMIALLNCTMLIWLYAALRPMFGVGVKNALIASLYWFVFVTAYAVNMTNLGYYPWKVALIESIYLLIELPLALLAGAYVYENK